LSLLEKNPFLHYYGDYSAPGLFLIDMAWDLALTGDKQFFLSMRDKILATLEWIGPGWRPRPRRALRICHPSGVMGRKEPGLEGSGERFPHAWRAFHMDKAELEIGFGGL
jgi:hypothetical protein